MYVFNGDLVDRGHQSIECAIIVLGFILLYPGSVFINRGNHEQAEVNERYGFVSECQYKYGMQLGRGVFDAFNQMFLWFPLVHVINKSVMVVHGGLIRRRGTTLAAINDIVRGLDHHEVLYGHPQEGIEEYTDKQREDAIMAMDLLWSDPIENSEGMRMNTQRGAGILFGADVVHQFLANNPGLRMVVRSHECIQDGYCIHFRRTLMEGKLVTVFSASNYHAGIPNKGAILIFPGADNDEDASTRCRVFTFTALRLGTIPPPTKPTHGQEASPEPVENEATEESPKANINKYAPGFGDEISILSSQQKSQIQAVIHRELVNMKRAFEMADLERARMGDFSPKIFSSSLPMRPARRSGDLRDDSDSLRFQREMSGPELANVTLTGKIRVSQWVEIMTAVLPRLPWYSLRHEILGNALTINGESPRSRKASGVDRVTQAKTPEARSSLTRSRSRTRGTEKENIVGGRTGDRNIPASSLSSSELGIVDMVGKKGTKEEVDYTRFLDDFADSFTRRADVEAKVKKAGLSEQVVNTVTRHSDVLETIFDFFDRDGSGRINIEEFITGCEVLNDNLSDEDKMTEEDMTSMMRLMDNDGDDAVNLEEFMECFQMCQEPTAGSVTTAGLLSGYSNRTNDRIEDVAGLAGETTLEHDPAGEHPLVLGSSAPHRIPFTSPQVSSYGVHSLDGMDSYASFDGEGAIV